MLHYGKITVFLLLLYRLPDRMGSLPSLFPEKSPVSRHADLHPGRPGMRIVALICRESNMHHMSDGL